MKGRALVAGALLLAAVVALVVAFTTGGSGSDAQATPGTGLTTPLWDVLLGTRYVRQARKL